MRFLRKGKVKEVYEVSEDELEFVFTDQISVFDKVIPTLIPHKGETLCRTSAHWFKVVQTLGVRTHFLRVIDGNRMRVRRVQVISESVSAERVRGCVDDPHHVCARAPLELPPADLRESPPAASDLR